ncbi:D-inositol 3-phosphate glycosyltransferase [Stieleria maiorica]|uniref:D-inositol 3-phosphate glycosyltransferase n=1 Tax=Stieleria maiorica TaxID=2795974 RepID=A0A5B9MHE7_9BACT|nr:glycosyltransferase [Stieleria maiorica]QEF99486.1 D-inositol 3-phosphate glycosyltransferase [Stieleria maiorica]
MSLNVIQVTGSDVGGGAEVVVREHHHELQRQGHRVQLLVGRKLTDDAATTEIPFRRGPKGVLRTARWLERNTGLQNLYSPGFRAIEDSFAFSPDVLHLHSLHGVESFAELSVLRRLCRKFPTLISLHDLWLMTGHCGHPLDCPRWKTGCGKCPDLTLYPAVSHDTTRLNFWRKRRLFRSLPARLIVPSNWLKAQVRQSPILKHLPVDVVPNPVDVDTFTPDADPDACQDLRREFGITATDQTVLMVAQHLDNPFKGVRDGIAVLNLIKSANVKVMLVGRAAESVAGKINHPCVILPFTDSKQRLADYYRSAKVLLMPSRGETFGLVAAEAMACGTPVVAFDVGGLADVIGDDIGGILISDRDRSAMARAVDELLSDGRQYMLKSDAGRERSVDLFSLCRHTRSCLTLYQHAIQQHATPA